MSFNKEYSLDNNFSLLQNEDNDDTPKYTFIDLSTNSSHKNLNSFITIPKFKKFIQINGEEEDEDKINENLEYIETFEFPSS